MSQENLKRRDFMKGAATAGLAAPLLNSVASGQNQLSALGQARPIVIASANGANVPKRGVEPSGVSCVERAMRLLKEGRDTLEAVVAGVNIVEDDPDEDSVGYGGLPNEDCEVELDSSVMHGPTRRAGAVAALRRIKNPSSVARVVMERTDNIMLVADGALRFAVKHGFKEQDLLTDESRKKWLAWRESLNPKDSWGPSWRKTAPAGNVKTSQAKLSPEEIALNKRIDEILRVRPTGTIKIGRASCRERV